MRERLRSTDLVTRESARAELGRALADRAAILVDEEPAGVALVDVLTGQAGAVELVRALADVTAADVLGIMPPSVGELVAPPLRPLFAGPWARPWVERREMLAPDLTAVTPVVDTADKSDIAAGGFTVAPRTLTPHTAAWGADFSVGVLNRATPRFRDTLAELILVALQRAVEAPLVTDLATGATASVDLVAAVAAAQIAYGGTTVILASDKLPDVWAGLGPVALVMGDVATVPVNAGAGTVLVTSAANLHVEVGPLVPLAHENPTMLGTDLGYYTAALAWASEPAAVYAVTMP